MFQFCLKPHPKFGRRLVVTAAIAGSFLAAGCGAQNFYEPSGFKAVCEQVVKDNSSLTLGNYSGMKFTVADKNNLFLYSYAAISVGCNELCYRAIISGAGPLLFEYNEEYFARYYAHKERPKYLNRVRDDGLYRYNAVKNPECEFVSDQIRSGKEDYTRTIPLDRCVSISRFDDGPNIVTANFLPEQENEKITHVSVVFSKKSGVIGRYDNAFYSYPPGPSIEGCLTDVQYASGFDNVLRGVR